LEGKSEIRISKSETKGENSKHESGDRKARSETRNPRAWNKSEARISKSETNPKLEELKYETKIG
jgi:hypothetical protein